MTLRLAKNVLDEARHIESLNRQQLANHLRFRLSEAGRTHDRWLYALTAGDPKLMVAGNLAKWPSELDVRGQARVFRYTAHDGRENVAVGASVNLRDGRQLLVAQHADILQGLGQTIIWWLLFGAALVLASSIIMGMGLSQLVLARIRAMMQTSQTIMAGDLSQRLQLAGTQDELDDLAVSLNELLARIEQLMTGFREVSDNIAHDLKTPLNRLRNKAEDALAHEQSEEAYKNSLTEILDESDQLIRVFNSLLQVARLEAGAVGRDNA